jgi:DNA-binding NtrC family response regulator
MLFSEGVVVDVGDLPPDLTAKVGLSQSVDEHRGAEGFVERLKEAVPGLDGGTRAAGLSGGSMKDIVKLATAELEKDLITRALDETQGNVTHAARRLKISRKSLQIKMKELGLRDTTAPADRAGDDDGAGAGAAADDETPET